MNNTKKAAETKKRKAAIVKGLNLGETIFKICGDTGFSRTAHYRWLTEDKKYARDCETAKDSRIKIVEDALYKSAMSGNTTAMIFFLCNRAQDRWESVNKIEHSVDPDNPLNFIFNGVKCIAGCEVKKDVNASDKRL